MFPPPSRVTTGSEDMAAEACLRLHARLDCAEKQPKKRKGEKKKKGSRIEARDASLHAFQARENFLFESASK